VYIYCQLLISVIPTEYVHALSICITYTQIKVVSFIADAVCIAAQSMVNMFHNSKNIFRTCFEVIFKLHVGHFFRVLTAWSRQDLQ
jgi:hypothetical protein